MGYIAHHTIIFVDGRTDSTFYAEAQAVIREAAERYRDEETDRWLALLVDSGEAVINGDRTFVFLPDGSKEGWGTSALGDQIRQDLMDLADTMGMSYAEVRFGGDDPDLARVTESQGHTATSELVRHNVHKLEE